MTKLIIHAFTVLLAVAAFAAVDQTYSFTYQACLRDDKGGVIKTDDGAVARNQTVTLRLWNSPSSSVPANLLWGRKYNVYTDETGLFNLEVSDATGSALAEESPTCDNLHDAFVQTSAGGLYIGLTVEGSDEIVPRQRVFAVPFASVANDVRGISTNITVSGKLDFGNGVSVSSGGFVQSSGTSTFNEIQANNLTVGGTALSDLVTVPIGGIIMWTKINPPDGNSYQMWKISKWAICNGQTVNGVTTPDLRGRFVVGVNDSNNVWGTGKIPDGTREYVVGDKGGSDFLDASMLPKHSHNVVLDTKSLKNGEGGSVTVLGPKGSGGTSQTVTSSEVGKSEALDNRPLYYALYYIMRVR